MKCRSVLSLVLPSIIAASVSAGFWLGIFVCRSAAMDAGVGRYEDGRFIYGPIPSGSTTP